MLYTGCAKIKKIKKFNYIPEVGLHFVENEVYGFNRIIIYIEIKVIYM